MGNTFPKSKQKEYLMQSHTAFKDEVLATSEFPMIVDEDHHIECLYEHH